jgi:hypothetical protein
MALEKKKLREITGNLFIDQKEGWCQVDVVFIDQILPSKVDSGKVSNSDSKTPTEVSFLKRNVELKKVFMKHFVKPYDILFSSFFVVNK